MPRILAVLSPGKVRMIAWWTTMPLRLFADDAYDAQYLPTASTGLVNLPYMFHKFQPHVQVNRPYTDLMGLLRSPD